MKTAILSPCFRTFSQAVGVTILLLLIPAKAGAQGAIVWDGPGITYTQPGSDPTQAANQDRLTSDVWLTRGSLQGLFNAEMESSYAHNSSPANTEWAYGQLANYASLTYQNWETWNGKNPPSMVGKAAVLHLISDNIYLSIQFTSWGVRTGGFAYIRSTPSPVPEPAVLPVVGLGLAALFLRRKEWKRRED